MDIALNWTICFVASKLDPAAMNMASILRDLYGSDEFRVGPHKAFISLVEGSVLNAESLGDLGASGADLSVIMSRHSGTPGSPVITTHVPGNFGEAKFGGQPQDLSTSMPNFMKHFLMEASVGCEAVGYAVELEPTHHGPSMDTPIAFVEVGSEEWNWLDERACGLAVKSAVRAFSKDWRFTSALAFGGPHINPKFTRVETFTGYAIGHAVRKFDADAADEEVIQLAVERSLERPQVAIFDWKGLKGAQKARLVSIVEGLGLKVLKARDALRGADLK